MKAPLSELALPSLNFSITVEQDILVFLTFLLIVSFLLYVITQKKMAKDILSKIEDSSKSLKNEINNSVQTKFIDISPSTEGVIEVGIEFWRLERRINKISKRLSEDNKKAFQNSFGRLSRFLEKNDLEVKDYTGARYNEGLNLDIVATEKNPKLERSLIRETIEPEILYRGRVIKKARVILVEK